MNIKYMLLAGMLMNVTSIFAQEEVSCKKTECNKKYVDYAKGSLKGAIGVTSLSVSLYTYIETARLYATGGFDSDIAHKYITGPIVVMGLIPCVYNSYNMIKDALYNFKLLQNKSKKSYKKSILKIVSGLFSTASIGTLLSGQDEFNFAGMCLASLLGSGLYTLGLGIKDCKDVYNKNNHKA